MSALFGYKPERPFRNPGVVQFLQSGDMRNVLMDQTRRGAAYAKSIAPVGRQRSRSQQARKRFRDSIQAMDTGALGGRRNDRAMVYLVANTRHAWFVEFGRYSHHTLHKAIPIIEDVP